MFAAATKEPIPKTVGDSGTNSMGDALSDDTSLIPFSDEELLELHEQCKREAFFQRQVFEKQWTRNIWYVLSRQWIEYYARDGQWKDIRLAKWVPRPVTNKCKTIVQAIRAMFGAIQIGTNCRPNGDSPKNISVAATCDQLSPLLHQRHNMDRVMSEFDWWLIVTGNAFLYTYWDYDVRHGMVSVQVYECEACGYAVTEDRIQKMSPTCPGCGGMLAPNGKTDRIAKGRSITDPLSPFELVFANSYSRFDEVPYVYRLRWRPKSYFANNPALQKEMSRITFAKAPSDTSLQLFKALSTQNDLGLNPVYWSEGSSAGEMEEGVTEYELWMRPCDKYPDGLLVRFVGERNPIVLHLEEQEAVPGPMPYKDAEGMPVFPFSHAVYEHVGGRVLGSGALDPIIQKQDQLNQLDSMILMTIQRMANPIWLEPKGAEVEKFTGEPGLVVKWNPLTVQGNAKPERLEGIGPPAALFQIREQYLLDIEELSGTFDIMKGSKPPNVEAFSALALLDERSKSRFASVFQSRGDAYAHNLKVQLELTREFGPDKITEAVLAPNRKYTLETFMKADLQGSVSVVVENGTQQPKTSLGRRAAIEHLNQLGFINPADPDQAYKVFQEFGCTYLSPSLDVHVQAAHQKQEAFEKWAMDQTALMAWAQQQMEAQSQFQQQAEAAQVDYVVQNEQASAMGGAAAPPQMPEPPSPLMGSPLEWRGWYNPNIHKQEFLKWANGDRIRELIAEKPEIIGLLEAHLMEMDIKLMEQASGMVGGVMLGEAQQAAPTQQPSKPKKGGNGSAMGNSNTESTTDNEPKGNGEGNQNRGPH
jgi:hypothetical protein